MRRRLELHNRASSTKAVRRAHLVLRHDYEQVSLTAQPPVQHRTLCLLLLVAGGGAANGEGGKLCLGIECIEGGGDAEVVREWGGD